MSAYVMKIFGPQRLLEPTDGNYIHRNVKATLYSLQVTLVLEGDRVPAKIEKA